TVTVEDRLRDLHAVFAAISIDFRVVGIDRELPHHVPGYFAPRPSDCGRQHLILAGLRRTAHPGADLGRGVDIPHEEPAVSQSPCLELCGEPAEGDDYLIMPVRRGKQVEVSPPASRR